MRDLGTIELEADTLPVISFSDVQAHNYKQHNVDNNRLLHCIDVFDRVFKQANKFGIGYILFSGDLVDQQKSLPTSVVIELNKCFKRNFERYPDIKLIAISGNHDYATKNLIDKPAVSALEAFSCMFDNLINLDDAKVSLKLATGQIIDIYGIPYYEYPEHFKQKLEEHYESASEGKNQGHINVLLQHQTPNGWLDLAADIFVTDFYYDSFDLVLNGHIHEYRVLREGDVTFVSVGNPLPRDLSDAGQGKGVLFFQLESIEAGHKFLNTGKKYPNFKIKIEGEELEEGEENDYITWQPDVSELKVEGVDAESFNTNLSRKELISNYCTQHNEDKEVLKYGVKMLGLFQQTEVN